MTKQVLIEARELYASAPSHAPFGSQPEEGTYCALSAIAEAKNGIGHYWDARAMLVAAGNLAEGESLVKFNATHTTEEVLALYDRAIEAAS